MTTLKAELASYEQAEKRYGTEISAARMRRGSVLDDGTELSIEPREMERMRAIFNLFDVQGNGFISEDDLMDLHAKLGEPISTEDAREAVSYMHSKSATGQIDFNSFMKWWNDDHAAANQTEAMRRYQAKFKFLKARIANPEVGNIETEAVGAFPSFEFRVNFYHTGPNGERQQISPWHDIPCTTRTARSTSSARSPSGPVRKWRSPRASPLTPSSRTPRTASCASTAGAR